MDSLGVADQFHRREVEGTLERVVPDRIGVPRDSNENQFGNWPDLRKRRCNVGRVGEIEPDSGDAVPDLGRHQGSPV